jgi:hypothetical protein
MADEETMDTQSGSDVDWEQNYKQLQRKYNRQQTKTRDSTQKMAELESGQRRIEKLLDTVLDAATMGDDTLSGRAKELRGELDSQRSNDKTAAQFEYELNTMLEDNDTDWQDDRLSEARRLLEDINSTGDLGRLHEVRRLTQDAFQDQDTDVDTKIQEAILKDRQDLGRVDTGTSVGGGQRFTRQDVAELDPIKLGVKGMREVLDKVYDQMDK